jgi:hypothetical protein
MGNKSQICMDHTASFSGKNVVSFALLLLLLLLVVYLFFEIYFPGYGIISRQ